MKNDTKIKTGNGHTNATAQLANLNRQIEELKIQKTALAEPMKQRHSELCSELLQVETEIRGLDPTWKPASLRPNPVSCQSSAARSAPVWPPMTILAIKSIAYYGFTEFGRIGGSLIKSQAVKSRIGFPKANVFAPM
jgi:hypothetical protein